MRFNLDTGAAQTAVPKDWVNDKVTVTGASEVIFKTASGELVPSEGTGTFEGFGESGMRCRVRGAIADVHKPLVSAHKCLGFGRIAVLDENGGQLVPVNSKAGTTASFNNICIYVYKTICHMSIYISLYLSIYLSIYLATYI